MRLLLNTHALIWWLNNPSHLSGVARDAINDSANDIYASAISAMETCTKCRLGMLPEVGSLANNFKEEVDEEGFEEFPISIEHAEMAGKLAIPPADPFDAC